MALSKSFIHRSLASSFVVASILVAGASAYAGNLANYSTSQWSGKSTAIGSFGAGYGASFTTDLTNGALVSEASGDASIQLCGTTISIVDLSATANINDSSSDAASLTAKVVGATVYSKSYTDGFTFDASEDVSNYDDTFCTSFFDVSTTFTIVVVPVTLTAGAEGCANLTFSATPQYNTTTHVGTLNLQVEPALNVDLTASVGVGSSIMSAGIEANVTLLDFTLPITVTPNYNFSTTAFTYGSSGLINLSMLDGSVDAYAKIDLGLWKKKYSYTLFDWSGINKSWYLWATGKPSVSGLLTTLSAQKATASYTYTDTGNVAEGSSSFRWYRNATASDTGRSQVSTSSSYTLVEADRDQYLQYCVTPKNSAGTSGDQQCSDWTYVGEMALLYLGEGYGTSNGGPLAIPFEHLTSGTCVNLTDYTYSGTTTYNDTMSSYKLYAPSTTDATFTFYKNTGCSDTASTDYARKLVSAGTSNVQTTTSDLGSTWNDKASSVMVVYNEWVAAENTTVSISGNTATAAYTFGVSENALSTSESGSTYVWYRASSSTGTGSATISGETSSTHTLTYADDRQYLKVCVTPSNGYSVGTQSCSDWTAVGHLLKLFESTSYTGSALAIAWEKSPRETCFNMTDYSFNDKISSFNWYNNSVASSTVWFYTDTNCGGSSATHTVAAGSSEAISSIPSSMGSSWNDTISSFKVSWNSSVNASKPSLTIYGNKATESHTYSDSSGNAEVPTYSWYRATDSLGANAALLDGATSNSYILTGDDKWNYLQVCNLSSNGVMVDESTLCSDWTYVGPLLRLWADTAYEGLDLNIAYQKSPSGTCFNMADYSFNDITSYIRPNLPSPNSGSATAIAYKDANCSGTSWSFAAGSLGTVAGSANDVISSVKVIY